MNCPYCKNKMVSGSLLGDESRFKWKPSDKKGKSETGANHAIDLGSGGTDMVASIPVYFCSDCRKIIFDQTD